MNTSKLWFATMVFLTAACLTADARGFFRRGSNRCCSPCQPNQEISLQQDVGMPVAQANGERPKRPGTLPLMKTLYYCVGGVWMARACGEDHTALEDLARLENKEPFGGTLKPDHRELSISLFADPARAQYYVIAEFGTLDGLSCN